MQKSLIISGSIQNDIDQLPTGSKPVNGKTGFLKDAQGKPTKILIGYDENHNPIEFSSDELVNALLSNKVDKINGKALSDNNLSNSLLTKLNGISNNANKTIIRDNLTTTNSGDALSAKQGYVLKGLIDTIQALISSDDVNLNTVQEIIVFIKANKSVIDSIATSKVDKVSGKGLSSNDFTNQLLTKLNGIATGANKYIHPASHPASIIAQDSQRRFVSDTEKSNWNNMLQNIAPIHS